MDDQPKFMFQTADHAEAQAAVDRGYYLKGGVEYDRLSLSEGKGDVLRSAVEQWVVRGYPKHVA